MSRPLHPSKRKGTSPTKSILVPEDGQSLFLTIRSTTLPFGKKGTCLPPQIQSLQVSNESGQLARLEQVPSPLWA